MISRRVLTGSPFEVGIDTAVYMNSRLVSSLTGFLIQIQTWRIVGANAFAHESGIPPGRRH
jgi:isopropylmalate/homocitrate/citramalate synthase